MIFLLAFSPLKFTKLEYYVPKKPRLMFALFSYRGNRRVSSCISVIILSVNKTVKLAGMHEPISDV